MIRFGVLGLMFAVVVAAQAPNEATLSGRIIDAATRQPITGAHISYDAPVANAVAVVTSDASGAYAIRLTLTEMSSRVDGLRLSVKVTKPGYATTSFEFANGILLKRSEAATRDFELRPAARITGQIVDRDTNDPIQGVYVTAWRTGGSLRVDNSRYDSGASDSNGSFSIADIDPGEYQLEFSAPERRRVLPGDPERAAPGYGTAWFPGVSRQEMANSITLAAGENRNVEMRVQKRALRHISGVIEFAEGIEPQELQMSLVNRAGGHAELRGDFPRAGKFHVDNLDEGSYELFVSTKARTVSNQFYASQAIEIADRDVDGVKLTMRRTVTLHTVFSVAEDDVPVPPDLHLLANSLTGWPGVPATTPNGNDWRDLPPGELVPIVMGPGLRGFAVASVLYGGRPATVPIDVETDSTITIVLTSKPGRIAGTLRTPDQQPSPAATIVLLPESSAALIMNADLTSRAGRERVGRILVTKTAKLTAKPDSAGAFRFDDLAPGRYQAVVVTENDRDRVADGVFLRNALRSASTVAVDAGQAATLELTLP